MPSLSDLRYAIRSLARTPGPVYGYYKRLATVVAAPEKESSFFDGIDTRVSGIFTALRRRAPASAPALLDAIEQEVNAAVAAYKVTDPGATVPALARGLKATRTAIFRPVQPARPLASRSRAVEVSGSPLIPAPDCTPSGSGPPRRWR